MHGVSSAAPRDRECRARTVIVGRDPRRILHGSSTCAIYPQQQISRDTTGAGGFGLVSVITDMCLCNTQRMTMSGSKVTNRGCSGGTAPDVSATVGSNLRALRRSLRLSLGELSRSSGVSRSMLSRIELGRTTPSIGVVWKIANAVGIPCSTTITPPHRVASQGNATPKAHHSPTGMRLLQDLVPSRAW